MLAVLPLKAKLPVAVSAGLASLNSYTVSPAMPGTTGRLFDTNNGNPIRRRRHRRPAQTRSTEMSGGVNVWFPSPAEQRCASANTSPAHRGALRNSGQPTPRCILLPMGQTARRGGPEHRHGDRWIDCDRARHARGSPSRATRKRLKYDCPPHHAASLHSNWRSAPAVHCQLHACVKVSRDRKPISGGPAFRLAS